MAVTWLRTGDSIGAGTKIRVATYNVLASAYEGYHTGIAPENRNFSNRKGRIVITT